MVVKIQIPSFRWHSFGITFSFVECEMRKRSGQILWQLCFQMMTTPLTFFYLVYSQLLFTVNVTENVSFLCVSTRLQKVYAGKITAAFVAWGRVDSDKLKRLNSSKSDKNILRCHILVLFPGLPLSQGSLADGYKKGWTPSSWGQNVLLYSLSSHLRCQNVLITYCWLIGFSVFNKVV